MAGGLGVALKVCYILPFTAMGEIKSLMVCASTVAVTPSGKICLFFTWHAL
jgi:hypothetical protein